MLGHITKVRLSSQSAGSSTRSTKGSVSRPIGKRKSWSRTGVSDIIANLLILAITVTLFSTIIWFVSSMPAPQPNSYGDFSSKVNYRAGEYVNITIKHMGGEPLDNSHTNIFIMTNSGQVNANITDSKPSIGAFWNLGATWTYNTTNPIITNLDATSKLEVMIIDTERNMVVWSGKLLDNTASSTPAILDRYLGQHVTSNIWLRASTFTINEYAALFVNVYDGGDDVKYVYADVSSLNPTLTNLSLQDVNKDNWWSMDFQITAKTAGWKTINITAVDQGERWTRASLQVNVLADDTNSGPITHETGLFPANFLINQLQGMNIFEKKEWDTYNYSAVATRNFDHSQQAVVVVASKFLVNFENQNTMYIIDPATRAIITTVSSPNYVFTHYDYYSGYYIYEALIDIPKLTDNKAYLVQVQLRDSWFPDNNVFFASDTIYVGDVEYPTITTYSDPDYSVHATNFTTSDKIYVKITNALGGAWIPSAGLVQITDYSWNMQVNRIPGSAPYPNPVENVSRQTVPINEYRFWIDLNYTSQDPWNPGKGSYMLKYDMFQTTTEKYLLATMVNITSPKIKLDLVEGQNGPNTGWSQGSLINFYQNNNQWVPPDFITNFPGKHSETFTTCNFVRLGDMNNNGRNDVIAVLDGFHIIRYNNNGMWTPSPIYDETSDSRGTVKAIQLGYINDDNLLDIIVAYADNKGKGEIGYYRNDGVWTYVPIASSTPTPTTIQAIDVNRTELVNGAPSSMSIVVGFQSGGAKIYTNNDGLGLTTSFTATSLPGGKSVYAPYNATAETSLNSTYGGTGRYSSTIYGSAGFEMLYEVRQNVSSTGTSLTLATEGYSVYPNQERNITTWANWNNQTPVSPFSKVWTYMSYTVPANSQECWILLNGTRVMTIPANPTSVEVTGTLRYNLTTQVTGVSDLQYLKFYLKNNATTTDFLTINYWNVDISFTSNNYILDHTFSFANVPQSVMTTFDIYANSSARVNHETYVIQYRIDGGAWTTMNNIVIDAGTTTKFSAIISPTGTGLHNIDIMISDVNRASTVPDLLYIKSMYMNCTSIQNNPIGEVTAVQIADMNEDQWPDIVISDKSGVWIYWNKDGYLNPTFFKSVTTGLTNIVTIGLGTFHGKTAHMDIAIATSSGVYLLTQTSVGVHTYTGTFTGPTIITPRTINNAQCMAVGDVFGNGYCSIVVASGSTMTLYVNRGTNFSPQTIDVLDSKLSINSVYFGMLRNS